MKDKEQIANEFRQHCGEERFNRFVRELDGYGRHHARLRHWQEQLWAAFVASSPHELPITAVEIAALFGLTIPSKVLHWVQLKDDQTYVLDLVQLPDGSRYLQPREISDPNTPHTVFSTLPAPASKLRDSATNIQDLRLENGERFGVDAHGIWMSEAECRHLACDHRSPEGSVPWVNGLPPQLPPK